MKPIKDYFIPHEGNDYKPHFLRKKTAVVLASIAVFVELLFILQAAFIAPHTNFLALILPDALIDETNTQRLQNNLSALKPNTMLRVAAILKAKDMASKSYFAHVSPQGYAPWYWLELAGYNFTTAGENLAIDFSDSQDVVNAWMLSPLHRENILNGNFSEIGIAAERGMYQGHPTIFVVQFFGKRAAASAPMATTKQAGVKAIPSVAKETAASTSLRQELFASVEGASTTQNKEIAQSAPVKKQSNIIQTAISSPHATTDNIFYLLIIAFSIALMLAVVIEIRIQHPELIFNGIALLMLVFLFIATNNFVGTIVGRTF